MWAFKNIAALAAGIGLICCRCNGAVAPETADDPGQRSGLRILLEIKDNKEVWYVGDQLEAEASLKNVSPDPISVLSWSPEGRHPKLGAFTLSMMKFPSQGKPLSYFDNPAAFSPARAKDFVLLEPGQQVAPKKTQLTLMLPGEGELIVAYANMVRGCLEGPRFVPLSNAWVGAVGTSVPVAVSRDMSPEMQRRYKELREILVRVDLDIGQRLKALDSVAKERHYFAAQFVRQAWKESSSPAIRRAALDHLVSLLEWGTAYESLSKMLQVLRDDSSDPEIRKRILAVIAKMGFESGSPSFAIADQGCYGLTDAQRDEILQVLGGLSRGRDPFLAVEAEKVLQAAKKAPH